MAVETIRYAPTLGTAPADSARGPSNAIWGSCPWAAIQQEPRLGTAFWDDFLVIGSAGSAAGGALAASAGQWATYTYQGGTISDGQKEGGVIKLASDGDNEGLTLLSQAGAFRFVTTSTLDLNNKMWFECRIAKSS